MTARLNNMRSTRHHITKLSIAFVIILTCFTIFIFENYFLIKIYHYTYIFSNLPRYTLNGTSENSAHADPINILIFGSKNEITQTFLAAHWKVPDPITFNSSKKIIIDSLLHKSYPTAPISNLYEYGRKEDLAFEFPGKDVRFRDHIRLWDTGNAYQGNDIWIAAASYDNGIIVDQSSHVPTHHTSGILDFERDRVANDLFKTGKVAAIKNAAFDPPVFGNFTAAGDFYEMDGDVACITFTQTKLETDTSFVWNLKKLFFGVYDGIDSLFTITG